MKVLFFRETSASNSSDDHRIVMLKSKGHDIEPEYPWSYGREDFFLASKKQKQRYLQSMLGQAFHQLLEDASKETVIARYKAFYKENNFEDILGKVHILKGHGLQMFDLAGSVGHQSSLPPVYDFYSSGNYWLDEELCVDFYREMFKDILRDDIAIEGGTDDCDHRTVYSCVDYSKSYSMYYDWLRNVYSGKIYARKDDSGTWILSSKNKGIFMLRFDDKPMEPLQIPYLVDLNVTEWCDYNCSFCYRGCTVKGKTVKPELCKQLVAKLVRCGVMELVLGSGNTAHLFNSDERYGDNKDLGNYIDKFKVNGDTYSVSTTLNWQSFLDLYVNVDIMEFVRPLNSLAVSITDAPPYRWEQLIKIAAMVTSYTREKFEIKFQFIPELLSQEQREKLMNTFMTENICLLGFKNTGRGEHFPYHKLDDKFWKYFESGPIYYLTVDATFADRYKDELTALNRDNVIRTCRQEGICSCFLDPLRNRLYENSHSEKYVDFDAQKFAELPVAEASDYLKQAFAKLQEKK